MELLQNPLVIAFIAGFAVIVVVKLVDQWRDARQKEYQEIGDAMDTIGQDLLGDYFKARARDGNEEAVSIAKGVVARLRKPGGPQEVICTMMIKSLKDPDFMDNKDVQARLAPVLAERVLGLVFTPELRKEMATVVPELREYGSVQVADFFMAAATGDVEGMKAAGRGVIALCRNRDQLDDELMKRAEKAIPKLMKMPEHAPRLLELVNGPPSLEQQKADLEKRIAATKGVL